MIAKMRMLLTASALALVAEGDPEGSSLYASIGDEIPDDAAERFGLVDGYIPGTEEHEAALSAAAAAEQAADDAAKAAEDAAAKQAADEAAAKAAEDAAAQKAADEAAAKEKQATADKEKKAAADKGQAKG